MLQSKSRRRIPLYYNVIPVESCSASGANPQKWPSLWWGSQRLWLRREDNDSMVLALHLNASFTPALLQQPPLAPLIFCSSKEACFSFFFFFLFYPTMLTPAGVRVLIIPWCGSTSTDTHRYLVSHSKRARLQRSVRKKKHLWYSCS